MKKNPEPGRRGAQDMPFGARRADQKSATPKKETSTMKKSTSKKKGK